MWHSLKCKTTLEAPIDEVFAFFSEAENLERITPPELQFRILTPTPIDMAEGVLIDYRLRLNGLPFRWKTRISLWNPPHAFEDTQLKGPYRDWIHRHSFEAVAENQTVMTDHVRYRLPFFPLGQIAYPIVSMQVRKIFRYRNKIISDHFAVKPA
jgi:ligand-binding SRPBCC domain-containing protein